MAPEHNFFGTWEIYKCTFEGNDETWISGLEGIKFRLDENSDITFYNDLVSPVPDSKQCDIGCDSASVLFSCETFDVNELNPRLIFGAFAGHSIEFNTNTLVPLDELILECENWYTINCKRLKEDHVVGQEKQFSLGDALKDTYFSDVVIKSSDGMEYHCHSVILRLNGFDCSMCSKSNELPALSTDKYIKNDEKTTNTNIQIAITTNDIIDDNVFTDNPKLTTEQSEINNFKNLPKTLNLSPTYLQLPSNCVSNVTNNTNLRKKNQLSTSFNCLNITLTSSITELENNQNDSTALNKYRTSSDSNLQQSNNINSRNIFNFSNDIYLTTNQTNPENNICYNRRPPLSPYKMKSLFPIDTPPNSPLTPVSVLNNLPSVLLVPILNWIYSESLIPNLNEDICEKLINFGETQPSLNKLVEPCRKYLKLIRLKKVVIDIIMDIHNIVNKIIQKLNPLNVNTEPNLLFGLFKDCLKDVAIGCAKILQFCNLFVKDIADISRNQKNEIIKYVRTRIPIFLSQIHQLLKNILEILSNLDGDKKNNLITYLVPEIENSFKIFTNVIEEIKNSLEKLCKDIKCSHLDLSMKKDRNKKLFNKDTSLFSSNFNYETNSERNLADNDLKFVLYMYEVRKMRDIYGKISTMLDILKEKKSLFCEMNFLDKKSTINQNLGQLIYEIPNYILIIENISDRFDEKLGWKEFKFCFKLATSQINGIITNLLEHKSALLNSLNQVCDLVQREEFIISLSELELLEKSNVLIENRTETDDEMKYDYKNIKLNIVKNLCEPPIIVHSILSKNALRLLHSGQLTDMEFEIRPNCDNDSNTDYLTNKSHIFRAHRIIISTRCDWFKKALLSGMVESITRKIIIPDTSPVIFRRLLLYLYGAPIDKTVGAEQICELMLLADTYSVDDLKELCENTLNLLIDEYSVVCLLGIADRYGASALKSKCLTFLSQHPKLTKSDMFKELPQQIQQEVYDLIHWHGRVPQPWNDIKRHSLKSPSRAKSRSRKSSPSLI